MVDAESAGGKRNAETGFFVVAKLVVDQDGIFDGRAGILGVAIVVVVAVDDEDLLDGNGGALEQADLLGLFIFDGSAAAERIEMILGEIFLGELLGAGGFHFQDSSVQRARWGRLSGVETAGDGGEARFVESRPVFVEERAPAVEVGELVTASN